MAQAALEKAGYSWGNAPPMGDPRTGALFGTDAAAPQFLPIKQFRGGSLSQPFYMRERLRRKEPMIGYGVGLPNADAARVVGAAGYDFVFLDWEHTPMGISQLVELIRWVSLASEGNSAVFVRVPTHEHNWIAWALDAGASAVICPHTETVEQAKAIVDAARFYTSKGHRSYPPFSMFGGVNDGNVEGVWPWEIYDRAAVILQIESKAGADNADAICQVEGVDGIMVGHGDLRFDLGIGFAGTYQEPEYVESLNKIMTAAKTHGDKPVLTFAMGEQQVAMRFQQGFRLLMVGADCIDIARGMRQNLSMATETVKKLMNGDEKKEDGEPNGKA